MPPNKRRNRARSNHLLDVSRGKSKPKGPDAQLLDHEQTPLSIIGRSRVVLDAEEYERLQDAAERNTLGTTAAAEDSTDRALRRRADTVEREPERETPPVGESLERFVANIDQDTPTALEVGDTDQVGDQDPFEEFARLRRPRNLNCPCPAGQCGAGRRKDYVRPNAARPQSERKRRPRGPTAWSALVGSHSALVRGAGRNLGRDQRATPRATLATRRRPQRLARESDGHTSSDDAVRRRCDRQAAPCGRDSRSSSPSS
jgi:hypothetical protein